MKKCNFQREYRKALRQVIADARAITGAKKVPAHLRTASKSHAKHLAKVRCQIKRTGQPYSTRRRKVRRGH